MFTLTDPASRLQISALDRASPSEMQTHQECPPRRITPLEYALTKNSACKSFRIRTYNFIGLKARGMNTYKKEGGWGCLSLTGEPTSGSVPSMSIAALPGLFPWFPLVGAAASRCLIAARFGAERFHRQEVPCPDR